MKFRGGHFYYALFPLWKQTVKPHVHEPQRLSLYFNEYHFVVFNIGFLVSKNHVERHVLHKESLYFKDTAWHDQTSLQRTLKETSLSHQLFSQKQ